MVTIIVVIINHDVWIKYTEPFSVGTLITHIIKVYLICVFQHGCSNPVRDSSRKIVFLYKRKTLPYQDLNSGPFVNFLQVTAISPIKVLNINFLLSKVGSHKKFGRLRKVQEPE